METSPPSNKINVLFLAAEAAPLVKVGGLGDVAGSLPGELLKLQTPAWQGPPIDVRLVLPYHGEIARKVPNPLPVMQFTIPHESGALSGEIFLTEVNSVPVYLVAGSPIDPQAPVYSKDTTEDARKYVFFSEAVLELIKKLDWPVHILHANDWHTAPTLYSLRKKQVHNKKFKEIKSILTIHNLPFMGKDAEDELPRFGYKASTDKRLPLWARLFPLPIGLSSADKIVAVSPGYAREILTPEFGCGLQEFLNARQEDLLGILNGLDQVSFDPYTDNDIPVKFNLETISQRALNKSSLQRETGLPENPDIPLLIIISRMDQQKGIDLAVEGLRELSESSWQAILLGTGDPLLETSCRSLEAEMPDRVRALIKFDEALSRRMYAGGDIILMPSRYEPCGLAQMIAMRYGCVPLARATGGLKDTIQEDQGQGDQTGFLFPDSSSESFSAALIRALARYQDKNAWLKIQSAGMQQDFSWSRSALSYAQLYRDLTGR